VSFSPICKASLFVVTTNGRNGQGGISVPGVKAGDIILSVVTTSDNHIITQNGYFTAVQPTDDEIYQHAEGNFSSTNFQFVLVRP
jgi:hypothetical protein